MPRFYTPEWVEQFNRAVADLDLSDVETAALAAGGRFAVAQLVHGGPDGEILVTLAVDEGRLRLEVGSPAAAGEEEERPAREAAVTISLSYEDAAALSKGELDPAGALGKGRVRVRGDLAVLVAGQALLAAAGERLAALQAATTY